MIIQPPQNQSVCEGGAVNFTCVVMFTSRIPSAAIWLSDSGTSDATSLPGHTRTDDSNGRSAPANVTTVLTVTNIRFSDNGTDYFCAQGFNERSNTVYLTVLGKACAYSCKCGCITAYWETLTKGKFDESIYIAQIVKLKPLKIKQ